MSNQKEKKGSGRNPLFIPMILSLCVNIVLVVAVVLLAFRLASTSAAVADTTDDTDAEETAEEEDTSDEDEEEEETYYFIDYNDETIQITSYDAYIDGEYICAGDATNWVFTYDEDTETTTVDVTDEDGEEIGTYGIYFYVTEDEEDLVCNIISEEDEDVSYIYYVITILDDEDSSTAVGIYFENATEEDDGFVLYIPDAYEEYIVNAEEESEETESSEETEDSEESDTSDEDVEAAEETESEE